MPQITLDDRVLKKLDATTVQRGRGYAADRQVTDLRVIADNADSIHLTSVVKGTARTPYKVAVLVRSGPGGWLVDGTCTCPVGYNCKHVAATLLIALDRRAMPTTAPSPVAVSAPAGPGPQPLSIPATHLSHLASWLNDLAADAVPSPEAAQQSEQVQYLLGLSRYVASVPVLDPVMARPIRKGGWGSIRKMTLATLAQSTAKGVTPVDRVIARLASSGTYTTENLLPDDPTLMEEVLRRTLDLGRLWWRDLKGDALRPGPTLPSRIAWKVDSAGRQVPVLEAYGDVPDPIPLGATPWYVSPTAGVLGRLDLPADPPVVRRLLNAPALDPVAATMVATRLQDLLPHLARPARGEKTPRLALPTSSVAVEVVTKPPAIHLLLATVSTTLPGSGAWHGSTMVRDYAWLAFDYGAGPLVSFADGPLEFREVEGGRVRVRPRLRDLEADAVQRLKAAGFLVAGFPVYAGGSIGTIPPGQTLFAPGQPEQTWLPFMAEVVPDLRRDGWTVTVAQGFRWQVLSVDSWEGEVQPTGPGWFDLDLGIQVDGVRIPLLPLLLAALTQRRDLEAMLAANPDAALFAPLPDGRQVALPVARIAPLARVLMDLFAGSGRLDDRGRARIDLGRAAMLDQQTDLAIPDLLRPDHRARLRALLEPVGEAPVPSGLATDLRPYQRRGLAWLQALDAAGTGGILADDMGLGKTLQVIALLQSWKEAGRLTRPALVIAPTSVAPNWLREAGRHAPGLRVHLHHGPDRGLTWPDLTTVDLIVTSYPLLLRDHVLLGRLTWSLLVLDEAQAVKNQAGKLAALVRTLPADRRLCVTGTPLENHLGELWTQMDFVMPGLLGDSKSFTKLFRTPVEKKGDTERQRLLSARLKPFILRRSKGEVATDLPPKTEIIERIPLGDDQTDLYEALRLVMDAKVRNAIAAKGLGRSHIIILEALLRLRQVCCDPLLLPKTGDKVGRHDRRMAGSAKRTHLMQMLPGLVEEGRRILLFSQFTSMLDLIRQDLDLLGLRHVSLTGDTTDRMTPVDTFQSGGADIFLISLKAGGTGLTLTAADTVIHYDPWWNPAVEDQATDRAHRIGQDKPVFVYRLVADGTVEDRMLELQARKRALAQAVHEVGADSPGALTEADIDALFAPIRA
ncbi:MAG: hypothetical protein RLY86_972 [Pseudomonadota bacterium]|jgi:superfamily II DNA or RNA helicase